MKVRRKVEGRREKRTGKTKKDDLPTERKVGCPQGGEGE
jgi:hypothetical protein